MSNIIASPLKQARIKSGLKVDEIAQTLGVSQQTYYNYESGNREPSAETLKTLAAMFSVTTDFLLGVTDEMSNIVPMDAPLTYGAKIKVLGKVPAGVPIEAVECVIDEIDISKEMAEDEYEYLGLLVSGDSMFPEYLDGDIVIIRKQSTADTGDDVVAYVNGYDATLKRLQRMTGGIRLKALNPQYESKFYSNDEIKNLPVNILGVVVEMRRTKK